MANAVSNEEMAAGLRRFGHASFRDPQEGVIRAILDGSDALVLLPTGGGKSLCYQLPAMLLPGVTLVVSPLISLMQDQVAHLTKLKIPVGIMCSANSASEKRAVETDLASQQPRNKLLYVTPELCAKPDFRAKLRHLAKRGLLSLLAVDEAHCISSWWVAQTSTADCQCLRGT
jgi:bloom syndrome protein